MQASMNSSVVLITSLEVCRSLSADGGGRCAAASNLNPRHAMSWLLCNCSGNLTGGNEGTWPYVCTTPQGRLSSSSEQLWGASGELSYNHMSICIRLFFYILHAYYNYIKDAMMIWKVSLSCTFAQMRAQMVPFVNTDSLQVPQGIPAAGILCLLLRWWCRRSGWIRRALA